MRLLLLVLCVPFASHATGKVVDAIAIVDARCAAPAWLTASAPLEITRRRSAVHCAPGGPCTTTKGSAVDASELTVMVAGCKAPLKGRFKATKRKCDGVPVFRFSGRLPKGQKISIQGAQGGASLRIAGTGRLRCERQNPTEISRQKSRVIRVSVPRSAFSMQGGMVVLAPSAFGAGLRDEPLYGQWSLDALKATKHGRKKKIRLEMLVTTSQSRMPPEMGCWIREEVSIDARVTGTNLVLTGVDSRSRSEGVDPPPVTCPPLPKRW